jgi:hypothetical protein
MISNELKMVCLLDVICQAVLAGPGRAGCLDGSVRQGLPAVGTRQHTVAGFWKTSDTHSKLKRTHKNTSFLDKKKYINRILLYKSVFWQKSVFR